MNITLESGWSQIKSKALDRLESILEEGFKKGGQMFPPRDFAEIYTISYNMCTQNGASNHSSELYTRHGETMADYLCRCVLPILKEKRGEPLLREFLVRAENHDIMNKWNKKFFSYLDRFYTSLDHKNGNSRKLPSLEQAGLIIFKTVIFDAVKEELASALVALINNERDNNVIDRDLVRSVIQIFEKMGTKHDVYRSDFETPFLLATADYFKKRADAWITEDSTSTYLQKVEQCLEEEKGRVHAYLVPVQSEEKLLKVVQKELITNQMDDLLFREGSGCHYMLKNDKNDDLARMFRLFARIDELDQMGELFKNHVLEVGSGLVKQVTLENPPPPPAAAAAPSSSSSLPPPPPATENTGTARGAASSSSSSSGAKPPPEAPIKDLNDDPQFVKDLIAVYDKYVSLANEQFEHNIKFQACLKDAFTDIINRDLGKYKMTELLASFCDRLLKSGSVEKLSDAETEKYLDKTVQLFFYLSDKDVFADIYKNHLAKRLLNQRSASDEMERLMVGKLKLKCGAQFTSKFEGMLNDLSLGVEHMQSFQKYFKDKTEGSAINNIDFGVQLLTTGHWPTYREIPVNLPPTMQKCADTFKEYYDNKNPQRRLQWTHSLGGVTIKCSFGGKSYDVSVTTLQAVALMAFCPTAGSADAVKTALTFEELKNSLGLAEDILKRVLHSLSCGKYKVLRQMPAEPPAPGEKPKAVIKSTDSFKVNDKFTSPVRKFRIPMASLDDSSNPKRVEEDRSFQIDAAIVRIMKARKTLAHQELLAEVMTQLIYFKPEPRNVKKRIEGLIERDYLERDEENMGMYKYLA